MNELKHNRPNFMSYNLLDQKLNTELNQKKVNAFLENYQNIISFGIETMNKVKEGYIPDPTVGENACQIRAAMFGEFMNSADFSNTVETTKINLENTLQAIKEIKPKIDEKFQKVRKEKDEQLKTSYTCTLENLLENYRLNITLDERICQLIAADLLMFCRMPKRSFEKLDGKVQPLEKIEQIDALRARNFSANTVTTIDKAARKYLSEASVQFLQKKAKMIIDEDEQNRLYSSVSGQNVKTTKLGLSSVPCFSGSEIIFAQAHQQKIPLVVKVLRLDSETASQEGEEIFFFQSDGSRYCQVDKEKITQKAMLVCEAVSIAHPVLSKEALQEEIKKRDIKEAILAFMATHPIYGGELKTVKEGPEEENEKRKEYIDKALEWGCCPDNQRICRLYHMYASSNIINKNEEASCKL